MWTFNLFLNSCIFQLLCKIFLNIFFCKRQRGGLGSQAFIVMHRNRSAFINAQQLKFMLLFLFPVLPLAFYCACALVHVGPMISPMPANMFYLSIYWASIHTCWVHFDSMLCIACNFVLKLLPSTNHDVEFHANLAPHCL